MTSLVAKDGAFDVGHALAIFEWIEAWYEPVWRQSYTGMLSPNTTKLPTRAPISTHDQQTKAVQETGGSSAPHSQGLAGQWVDVARANSFDSKTRWVR